MEYVIDRGPFDDVPEVFFWGTWKNVTRTCLAIACHRCWPMLGDMQGDLSCG